MVLTLLVPSASRSRDSYHHGDLRNALELAAADLVTERGVHGFTLAETSRRAGVSAAAPFKHFANKEALLASLALRGYHEQASRFGDAVARTDDPVEQLAEFAAAYVRFAREERALFEVTFAGGLDKTLHPELEEAGQRVLEALDAPAKALRADPHDALELVKAVAAVAHGYAAFLDHGVFGDPATASENVETSVKAAARTLARSA